MDNNYTEICIVLDRSGSMDNIRADMEGGLNSLLADQKKLDQKCLVTLYQFDDEIERVFSGKDVKDLEPIKLDPRGSTALHDAMGRAIKELGSRLSFLPEAKRPGKVIFIVITDGMENSSREYAGSTIKQMVEEQTRKYSWQFVFLGADQDAVTVSQGLGFLPANALRYSNSSFGAKSMLRSVSNNIQAYACGVADSMSFSSEDRAIQDDLLKGAK